MQLILEMPSWGAKIAIEYNSDDLTFEEVIDQLVRPALLAVGYHPDTIAEYFDNESHPDPQSE